MFSIKIKVCGITQIEQVHQLTTLGVDYAGFIFYEKSPRFVVGKIDPADLKSVGNRIEKVGVFVNEDYDTVINTVEKYGLNYVQLHGDETSDFCKRVSSNVKTIKAFRLAGEEDLPNMVKGYVEFVDYFLFDTKAKDYGGTGKKFEWDILQTSAIGKPFFLSGGIGPDDTFAIKSFIDKNVNDNLYALDLNSKFELTPGIKNIESLKTFIDTLRTER